MSSILGFPNPVNEKAARTVAAGVSLACVVGLITGWMWLLVVLAAGFWLRVISGPTLSPLGQFATRVAAPRLGEPRMVPGPPKRFAQTIGAVTTTVGSLLAIGFGIDAAGYAVFGILALFAGMESALAYCVGCRLFSLLIRFGLVPGEVCEACSDVTVPRS